VEKVLHSLEARKHKEDPAQRQQRLQALAERDPLAFERDKVKGAIRTDFILSAEIVAITLGIVAEAPLLNQILILSGIAILVTIGVYGLVGVIVKLDDMGYWLAEKRSALAQWLGKGLLAVAPWLMKVLSIVGTLAMFLVGGGIVVHGIAPLHHAIEHWSAGWAGYWLPAAGHCQPGAGFYHRRGGAGGREGGEQPAWRCEVEGCTQRTAPSSTLKARPASTPAGALMSSGLRNVLRENDG
jgi:predicted DNA repair protein MutK